MLPIQNYKNLEYSYIPNTRTTYYGTVSSFSQVYPKNGRIAYIETIYITDIVDIKGNKFPNQWFKIGKIIDRANPELGDRLEFNASIMGYNALDDDSYTIDYDRRYRLGNPSKVKKIELKSIVKRL